MAIGLGLTAVIFTNITSFPFGAMLPGLIVTLSYYINVVVSTGLSDGTLVPTASG